MRSRWRVVALAGMPEDDELDRDIIRRAGHAQGAVAVQGRLSYPVHRHTVNGVVDLTIPLPADGAGTGLNGYLDAVVTRERQADVASLQHALAPGSVAVIGASRQPGTVGRTIWDNLRSAAPAVTAGTWRLPGRRPRWRRARPARRAARERPAPCAGR